MAWLCQQVLLECRTTRSVARERRLDPEAVQQQFELACKLLGGAVPCQPWRVYISYTKPTDSDVAAVQRATLDFEAPDPDAVMDAVEAFGKAVSATWIVATLIERTDLG